MGAGGTQWGSHPLLVIGALMALGVLAAGVAMTLWPDKLVRHSARSSMSYPTSAPGYATTPRHPRR